MNYQSFNQRVLNGHANGDYVHLTNVPKGDLQASRAIRGTDRIEERNSLVSRDEGFLALKRRVLEDSRRQYGANDPLDVFVGPAIELEDIATVHDEIMEPIEKRADNPVPEYELQGIYVVRAAFEAAQTAQSVEATVSRLPVPAISQNIHHAA